MRVSTSFSALLAIALSLFLSLGCSNDKKDKTAPPVSAANNASTQQEKPQSTATNPWSSESTNIFEVVDETFVLPETDDLKEIKQFGNMINKSAPPDFPENNEDWQRHFKLQRQYFKALYDTGVRIFEHPEATEKDKKNALKMQGKGLVQIAGYDVETYMDKLRQLAEELEKDVDTAKIALGCWSQYHMNRLAMAAAKNDEQSQLIIDQTLEFVEEHKNETSISMLVGFMSTFLAFNQDEDIAETNSLKLQEILESSDVPMYKGIAKNIPNNLEQGKELRKQAAEREKENALMAEGKERREALPGNEMEFECILLNGDKLNLKDLDGKVVLVDFWATWCGPCIYEIPGMLAAYEKYHDDGFEIIGYSTDRDLDALKEFQEERQLPWNVASRAMSLEAGLANYSTHYGVNTIPTMILVGKDGKVVSVHARGPALTQALEDIFGH